MSEDKCEQHVIPDARSDWKHASKEANTEWFQWFVGFTDGEGCFTIVPSRYTFVTHFRIGLRDDDLPLLLEIQETLQFGTVCKHNAGHPSSNPAAAFQVQSHSDCMQLVELFDQFPLKSKKSRDYRTWREAVFELEHGSAQRNNVKLRFLYEKIKLERRYEQLSEIEEYEPEGYQLEFWKSQESDEATIYNMI